MTLFAGKRSLRFTLSVACALVFAGAWAAALLSTVPALASGKGHSSKTDGHKRCYETGTFRRGTVRVPTSCSKPDATRKCYLTSTYDGRSYRQQIDCPRAKKPGSVGGAPATGATGGSGGGVPATTGNEGVNWSTARASRCDDGSTATSQGGFANCTDGSGPYCTDGTAYVVVDPQNHAVVCLPNASVPPTGVCDDGSAPGSGGTDAGTPLCADGDDAYLPGDTADDSASYGSCDDGSDPGDGGPDSTGAPLCADGTAPSY